MWRNSLLTHYKPWYVCMCVCVCYGLCLLGQTMLLLRQFLQCIHACKAAVTSRHALLACLIAAAAGSPVLQFPDATCLRGGICSVASTAELAHLSVLLVSCSVLPSNLIALISKSTETWVNTGMVGVPSPAGSESGGVTSTHGHLDDVESIDFRWGACATWSLVSLTLVLESRVMRRAQMETSERLYQSWRYTPSHLQDDPQFISGIDGIPWHLWPPRIAHLRKSGTQNYQAFCWYRGFAPPGLKKPNPSSRLRQQKVNTYLSRACE